MLEELAEAEKVAAETTRELEQYKEKDPEIINSRKKKAEESIKHANRWTGKKLTAFCYLLWDGSHPPPPPPCPYLFVFFFFRQHLLHAAVLQQQVRLAAPDFNRQFGLPEDFDYC